MRIKKIIILKSMISVPLVMSSIVVSCFNDQKINFYTSLNVDGNQLLKSKQKIRNLINDKIKKAKQKIKKEPNLKTKLAEYSQSLNYIKEKLDGMISDVTQMLLILNNQTQKFINFFANYVDKQTPGEIAELKKDQSYSDLMVKETNYLIKVINKIIAMKKSFEKTEDKLYYSDDLKGPKNILLVYKWFFIQIIPKANSNEKETLTLVEEIGNIVITNKEKRLQWKKIANNVDNITHNTML